MMWREPEEKIFPILEEFGIVLVAFAPLCKGFLSGRITPETVFAESCCRLQSPRFDHGNIEPSMRLVKHVSEIAAEKKATPAQVALRWVNDQKPRIVPIPGTTSNERLRESFAAMAVEFTPKDIRRINGALDAIPVSGGRCIAECAKRVTE